MPNPAASGLPNPQRYDVTTAGVVQDLVTGLTWQRPANTTGLFWPAANTICRELSLAGHQDWRVPSLLELVSLVDFTRTDPAIDNTVFPAPVGGTVWTSTPVFASPGEYWYVSFNNGFTYQGHGGQLAIDLRCVRGAAPDPVGARYSLQTSDVSDVVLDHGTRLTWQRAAAPTTRSWADAGQYCRNLTLSGTGWRLPSMKELQTLLDLGRQGPAIDPAAFPAAPTEQYWSSSLLAGSSTDAWSVSFRVGAASPFPRDSVNWVRCVR